MRVLYIQLCIVCSMLILVYALYCAITTSYPEKPAIQTHVLAEDFVLTI